MMKKNIVVGLGEIGNPILKILSKHSLTVGFDTNEKLMNTAKFNRLSKIETNFLHICIPFGKILKIMFILLTLNFALN